VDPRAIDVILFDLDDTLFAHQHAVSTGVAAHLRSLGGALAAADPSVELARWRALEEHHYHRYLTGEIGFLEQRRERARAFVEPYGIALDDRAADAWFGEYLEQYRRAWKLQDDTLECLDALSGYRFGVITNGDIHFQTAKLDTVGLSARMEHVVASGELGFSKPDAHIFTHACELFGVPRARAIYVGDRLHTDAIGAARAGLVGVWLNRTGTRSADSRPDSEFADDLEAAAAADVRVIASLTDLPALVAGL
jgi:putative hydrolase of the HAD superfamily